MVQLVEYSKPAFAPRLSVQGVHTCKSPLCPLCAPKWQRTRSNEITRAIDHWGPERVFFVTLTMGHHRKMRLALLHRLLTMGFGNLWSGRAGQDAAAELGGKPEAIRAHDRTWSDAHGWHPHIHALIFVRRLGVADVDMVRVLEERWGSSLAAGLRRMKRLATLILTAPGVRRDFELGYHRRARGVATPRQSKAFERRIEKLTDEHLGERARKVFGAKLAPARASLHDCMREVLRDLDSISEASIAPSKARGVRAERVRQADRAPTYLAKLGLELSTATTKLGTMRPDGLMHYTLWEVARLATTHHHPLRVPARRAWADLFRASFGTQTITFSNRERLGLGPDPYADEGEPEEKDDGELMRFLGNVPNVVWDTLAREQRHELHATLAIAHAAGELEALGLVESQPSHPGAFPHKPPVKARPPPSVGPELREVNWVTAEKRGAAIVREALDKATKPAVDRSLFLEEIRHRLELAIGPRKRGDPNG